jgi:hypothetical protein
VIYRTWGEHRPEDVGESTVKRIVAVLAVVVMPVLGFSSTADAIEEGACTISGTITFASQTASAGAWTIGPAVIDCQGIVAARRLITGRGPFRGAGTFAALAPGDSACLRQAGTGTFDYKIPTTAGDIVISEPENHTLAGIGVFNTPRLHGSFQVAPPYEGDCATKPISRATFLAQVVLYGYPRELPGPGRKIG